MIKFDERVKCIFSHQSDLENLFHFDCFPAKMGVTDQPFNQDIIVDLDLLISRSSGTVQINKLLPLDFLYSDSHGSGTVGKTWADHHKKFANFIQKAQPKNVLEIGGGSGKLAKQYLDLQKINWHILEPSSSSDIEQEGLTFSKDYFSEEVCKNLEISSNYDCIVHSHVLEHIYEPDIFLRLISSNMTVGSKMIISIPNMIEMLNRLDGNLINFEHTYFLDYDLVVALLNRNNFVINRVEDFGPGHSLFIETILTKSHKNYSNYSAYDINKSNFNKYFKCIKEDVEGLNSIIAKTNNVFIFGAHVFSQLLFALGLKTDRIKSVLDNDLNKISHRLYGTSLFVDSPETISKYANPNVIIRMGAYSSEIKNQLLSYNSSIKFI